MIDADQLDWAKMDGLIPAIVQHAVTGEVRMLGYMNRAALDATHELLDRPAVRRPTAIFATADETALGVLDAAALILQQMATFDSAAVQDGSAATTGG